MSKIESTFPLLKEGYDILECPNCGKPCYPDAKRSNGSIIYNLHNCKNEYELITTKRSFEITIDGELADSNGF